MLPQAATHQVRGEGKRPRRTHPRSTVHIAWERWSRNRHPHPVAMASLRRAAALAVSLPQRQR